ncbi:MAG: ribonuclease P protein component [Sphingomonadales bacterium]
MTATSSKTGLAADVRLLVLRERRDFLRVARTGRKWAMPGVVVQMAPTPVEDQVEARAADGGVIRFGLTASRKVGNAVRRNRARRRLRALARGLLPEDGVIGQDYVLIARHTTPERSFDALIADLKAALAKLKVTHSGTGVPRGKRKISPRESDG